MEKLYSTKGKKEYKEFRNLLRKGIGSRTQSQFADQVGIARQSLSRLLSADTIFRPTKSTLLNFSRFMQNVSYDELLAACDYNIRPAQEKANAIENAISAYFNDINGKLVVGSLSSMFETIDLLYLEDDIGNIKFRVYKEREPVLNDTDGADFYADVVANWSDKEKRQITTFRLYYTVTTSNCTVPIRVSHIKSTIEDRKESGNILRDKKAARRLLSILTAGRVPCTYCGPGLMYNEGTPEGFKQFLINHAGAFCTTAEKSKLYRKAIEEDVDMDEIFKDFEDNGGATGTGAVIAVILSEEMKELKNIDGAKLTEFLFYEKDEGLPEEEQNACIMCRQAFDAECITDDIKAKLYDYAKELKLKQFGVCHYHGTTFEDTIDLYNTETYYFVETPQSDRGIAKK